MQYDRDELCLIGDQFPRFLNYKKKKLLRKRIKSQALLLKLVLLGHVIKGGCKDLCAWKKMVSQESIAATVSACGRHPRS